jgi:hypothetical protein
VDRGLQDLRLAHGVKMEQDGRSFVAAGGVEK